MLGGSLAVLAVTLVRLLFPRLADVVSLSQARRAAGFVPFAFAFAGGLAVLAEVFSAAGAAARASPPGCCSSSPIPATSATRSQGGGPALVTWIAALGGAAALVAAPFVRRLASRSSARGLITAVAAALFVRPWRRTGAATGRRASARRPARSRPASCRR